MDEFILQFELDGNMWHCHFPNYVNPMESPEGFGATKKEALENFIEQLGPELT